MNITVIGAGIGGLTAACLLQKAGHTVTVLEAHIYPGGCAGTFFHKQYRFDAGATLAGGFAEGGPHWRVAQILGLEWPIHPVDPAWVVHLPDGRAITQWADPQQWAAEWQEAFPHSGRFWRTQQLLADVSWDISSRPFPWPPESVAMWPPWPAPCAPAPCAPPPTSSARWGACFLPKGDPMLRTFVDAQLLISAQTTSDEANALYASAALDLPRRGVSHVAGGMGGIAHTLADWFTANGGTLLYRQEVVRVEMNNGRATAVLTNKDIRLATEMVLANLTPWALAKLLGDDRPPANHAAVQQLPPTWGAFMGYVGLDVAKFRAKFPGAATHHQIVVDPSLPLGEGNSVFISMPDREESGRAPAGQLPVTLSTHTAIAPWWQLHQQSQEAYAERKAAYLQRLLVAAEQALPGFGDCLTFQTAGTPITFQRFTRRPQGMVGGFAQKSIWQARGPRTAVPNILLVGDSIFPGQSTAGVTLGALRVASGVMGE
jgi:C-3',4' desaturase CrtD